MTTDNSEWQLLSLRTERRCRLGVDLRHGDFYDADESTYTELLYTVHIRRRSLYYAFNVIVPCVMLSSLTLLTFCLPSNSREKIGLGLTVFLTFSMFMVLIAEAVPTTSESIPLIGQCSAQINCGSTYKAALSIAPYSVCLSNCLSSPVSV